MVDNPIHLADFGAALTSAESNQLQAVLESTKVTSRSCDLSCDYLTDHVTCHVTI